MGGYSIEYDALNDAEVYDVVKKSWTKLPSIPTPRGDCQAARLGDQILVIGGYYDEESNWSPDAFRNEVEAFQPVQIFMAYITKTLLRRIEMNGKFCLQ